MRLRRDDALTLAELSRLTSVSERNIRYYISQGLVPPAKARGPGAHYDQRHVASIRDVRTLVDEGGMSLAAVRTLFEAAGDDDVQIVHEVPADNVEPIVVALPTPAVLQVLRRRLPEGLPGGERIGSIATASGRRWQWYEVAPGVELHIDEDGPVDHANELLRAIRERLAQLEP